MTTKNNLTFARNLANNARVNSQTQIKMTEMASYIFDNIIKNLESYHCDWNGEFDKVTVYVNNLTISNEFLDEFDGTTYIRGDVFKKLWDKLKTVGLDIDNHRFVLKGNGTQYDTVVCLYII